MPSRGSWLAHPLARGLDLDDPRTTERRRRIILDKPFLRSIYAEWYAQIIDALPQRPGTVVEIGSGGGFLKSLLPDLVTSELLAISGVDVVLDARALPFRDGCLRAIVMTNVLHHIPEPRRFFAEASRCVAEGGRIICVEPWVSLWARFVMRFHHEPFEPQAKTWEFDTAGPLSGSNGALPWILFERDRALFLHEFPHWQLEIVHAGMPFRYLLSGGVGSWISAPGWSYAIFLALDRLIASRTRTLDLFATIVLTRTMVREAAAPT